MIATWRKARTLLSVWFAHMSAYRAEIVIWMLTGTIPLIMLAVWIGKTAASGGAVGDYTPQRFAAYFLGAWISQQFTGAWVSWEIDYQIRQGLMSPKLLRPLNPLWEHLAAHLTEHMVRAPFMVVILGIGLLLVPGTRITPDLAHGALWFISVHLAFLIRFLIAYCIGVLAFWWDQATALDELYFVVAAFLTGSFAPLELYPAWAQTFIQWTPFPYVIYYPVQVLNGTAPGSQIGRIMLVQMLWVVVIALGLAALWKRGLRRYGAVGA